MYRCICYSYTTISVTRKILLKIDMRTNHPKKNCIGTSTNWYLFFYKIHCTWCGGLLKQTMCRPYICGELRTYMLAELLSANSFFCFKRICLLFGFILTVMNWICQLRTILKKFIFTETSGYVQKSDNLQKDFKKCPVEIVLTTSQIQWRMLKKYFSAHSRRIRNTFHWYWRRWIFIKNYVWILNKISTQVLCPVKKRYSHVWCNFLFFIAVNFLCWYLQTKYEY